MDRDFKRLTNDPRTGEEFGYSLSVYPTLEGEETDITITGQLYSIGRPDGGNYDGEDFIINSGRFNHLNYWASRHPNIRSKFTKTGDIICDSESGQFYCYVGDDQTVEMVIKVLDEYMDRVIRVYENNGKDAWKDLPF